jgi:transposase
MANHYIASSRDQAYLLPPDVRDWLAPGHLAYFVVAAIAEMDTSKFHRNYSQWGPGRAAYDPDMLIALLLYAGCHGVRSSRRIEALCEVDVGYRVIAANQVPDHGTIARFRAHHEEELAGLFNEVLALCRQAGLAKLGVVALDGTKIAGSASMDANLSRAQIEAEVARMLKEAAEVDAAEDALFGDARGDELPPELADPRSRQARLQEAKRRLEEERRAKQEAEAAAEAEKLPKRIEAATKQRVARRRPTTKRAKSVARAEADVAVAQAQRQALVERRRRIEESAAKEGTKVPGFEPDLDQRLLQADEDLARARAKEHEEAQAATINTTDPDSAVMKDRRGFLQGYNAQAVVSEDQIILAAEVTTAAGDVEQFSPMLVATQDNLNSSGFDESIGTVLADAGYLSTANLQAPGPERLIATTRAHKLRRMAEKEGWREGPVPEGTPPIEAMTHRLLTRAGAVQYARRGQIVEPVFGQIKEARAFRRFSRRGLAAADSEWKFVAATHNLMKLFSHSKRLAAATA